MENRAYSWKYETVKDGESAMEKAAVGMMNRVFACTVLGVLKIWNRFEVKGAEKIPQGACIIAANHSSHMDAPAIMAALAGEGMAIARPAAAAEYFFKKPLMAWFAKYMLNAIPLERASGCAGGVLKCREELKGGAGAIMVFPEGTRTMDGGMGRFKAGAGLLAAGTDIPVVPCYISGTYEAMPKGSSFPKPGKVRIFFGEPLTFSGIGHDKASAEKVSAEIRLQIIALKAGAGMEKESGNMNMLMDVMGSAGNALCLMAR